MIRSLLIIIGIMMASPVVASVKQQSSYSFLDNRLLSHIEKTRSLFIPAGSAGFAKYLRYTKDKIPFKLQQMQGKWSVATMNTNAAALYIPMIRAVGEINMRIKLYVNAPGRMSVRINGKNIPAQPIINGWNELVIHSTKMGFKQGDNEIILFASPKSNPEIAWFMVASEPTIEPINDILTEKPFYNKTSNQWIFSEQWGARYYVSVPKQASIVASGLQDGCSLVLSGKTDDGTVLSGLLTSENASRSLSSLADSAAWIRFSVQGCSVMKLSALDIMTPSIEKTISKAKRPSHVLFWIMDSLRADKIASFYKTKPKTFLPDTPVFDQLAQHSAIFLNAYVQGNESRASHASIWASLYPVTHDMFSRKTILADRWVTLDEVAKEAGLFVSGVSGNGYIIARRGFGKSWDFYRNHIHSKSGLSGKSIMNAGIASLTNKNTQPWFLYLGTIDTHVSWRAKEPWFSQYDNAPYKGPFVKYASGVDIGKIATGKMSITKRDIQRIRALYDSNVSYQDKLLGDMLTKLTQWKIRDQTMIIITADHGDELWESKRVGHGGSLKETVVHVPLLVHYPPLFPTVKIEQAVESIDILPTLADVLDVPLDSHWQGVSLVALAHGKHGTYPTLAMSSQYESKHSARMGDFKLHIQGGRSPKLYHVKTDLFEKKNIAKTHHIALRMVSDPLWLLRTYNRHWKKSRWGNAANMFAHCARDFGE